MEAVKILPILLLLWGGNALSSYLHWKKINTKLLDLKNTHVGYLGSSTNKVNFFRKVLLIIVTDPSGVITDCQYLYGWTTFAKFRQKTDLLGMELDTVLENAENDRFCAAIRSSGGKIKEQLGEVA